MGVGANIGEGRRFTRFPRADLKGPGEWASHFPEREGGANATSCIACHNSPLANGAGDVALNVVVDPGHSGDPSLYLERNTLPLFALGVPQRLAEEMSLTLYVQRDAAITDACRTGAAVTDLMAKGVSFGSLSVKRTQSEPCEVDIDTTRLDGVDEDLVIKTFGWKGNHATIRAFTRGAAHNELGLQAVEMVGDADGDFDGVTHELRVGDMTALTIFMAGLERPVSTLELAALGLVEMTEAERQDILWGASLFETTGCNACHVSEMTVESAVFSEPATTPGFFDAVFPDGSDPAMHGLSSATAVTFDLASDQPNNRVELENGQSVHLGALRTKDGRVVANWFTDFKRHDMGPALADPDDPVCLIRGIRQLMASPSLILGRRSRRGNGPPSSLTYKPEQ
jgi:cytochrome c553